MVPQDVSTSFMVIVAILVGGGFFGIFGMFVGVPACAVICTVIRNGIQNRLTKKCMPIDLESYQNIDHLDAETLKTGGTICREAGK